MHPVMVPQRHQLILLPVKGVGAMATLPPARFTGMPIKALDNIMSKPATEYTHRGRRWIRMKDPEGRIHCRQENSEDRPCI